MSLRNAMNAGASGLNSEGQALGIVGDNISNMNTIGFKQSRAIFEDVLGSAVGGSGEGLGSTVSRTQQIFAQGSMLSTGQPTDAAISGDGFFVVNGSVNGVPGNYYTRAGQTSLRNDGTLVNPDGLTLQGYAATGPTTFSTSTGNIRLPATVAPQATSSVSVVANLSSDPAANVSNPGGAAFDATSTTTARATSNFNSSTTIYDSQGNAHHLTTYFRKTGTNTWEYHTLADPGEITGATPGRPTEVVAGTLTFGTAGELASTAVTAGGTASFVGATPGQAIAMNFGSTTATGGTGLDGMTQFSTGNNISSQSQDGYASGDLSGVSIDATGVVNGVFTNGKTIPAGRLAIARFNANDGLGRAGHNLWTSTPASGEAALGNAGAGGRGSLVTGALEQSNVDVTTQFVELISHQRAFQANSKTITTADQMLQELMNLKQ